MEQVHQQAISGIQTKHRKQATQLQQAIMDRENQIQALKYENIGLQG